jgi:hypothetical protein
MGYTWIELVNRVIRRAKLGQTVAALVPMPENRAGDIAAIVQEKHHEIWFKHEWEDRLTESFAQWMDLYHTVVGPLTVAVTQGSTTVTFSGNIFSVANNGRQWIGAGLKVEGSNNWFRIVEWIADNQATIDAAWPEANNPAATFEIAADIINVDAYVDTLLCAWMCEGTTYHSVEIVTPEEYHRRRYHSGVNPWERGHPTICTLQGWRGVTGGNKSDTDDPSTEKRRIHVWPVPDEEDRVVLKYLYYKLPINLVIAASTIGMRDKFASACVELTLAEAFRDMRDSDRADVAEAKAEMMLTTFANEVWAHSPSAGFHPAAIDRRVQTAGLPPQRTI